jgi:hypothetical protein
VARASDQSKTGFVTIATVRSRAEAQEIVAKLKAASIESLLSSERAAQVQLPGSRWFGGTKVQVRRSDVGTALRTLQRSREDAPGSHKSTDKNAALKVRWRLDLDSWQGAVIAFLGITAIASVLALWLF